jgi:hypothetical protein
MADQFDRESVEQRNEALERQNQLLERQIDALARSADLSNTLLDTLKEELGIQTRKTAGETNLLAINKKINKEITNQKFGLSNIATITKQKEKNEKLVESAMIQQKSLQNQLLDQGKRSEVIRARAAANYLDQLAKTQNEIDEINRAAERGLPIDFERLKSLEDQQVKLDQQLDNTLEGLSTDGRRLATTIAQANTLEKINEEREEEIDKLEQIEKTLGVTGKLMNFISNVPGIGKFAQDAYAKITQEQKALAEAGEELMSQEKTIGRFGEEIADGITETLNDPLTLGIALFKQLGKTAAIVDSKITGIQKQLGLGRLASTGIAMDFSAIAFSSSDAFITSTKLAESFTEMSNQLGFAVDYSGQTLETFTTLNKRLGLSVEQSTALTSLLKLQGDNTEDQLDNLIKQVGAFNTLNGTAFDTKQTLGDIANAAASIQVSFAGSTDELAASVLEAKKLGLNLSAVDKIADSLLQFETSIENELKAELLIGREINLEKARLLALNNDIAGVAQELQEQQVDFFEFSRMNRIQQSAIADALGMSREEMSQMLLQQQRMTMTNDEISSQLEGQELSNFKQLTAQEALNSALEKMQDIFVNIAEGPIGIIAGFFADILSSSVAINGIMAAITAKMGMQAIASAGNLTKAVATAAARIWAGVGGIPVVGIGLAAAGVTALLASIRKSKSTAQSVKDGIAPAAKGPFTITDAYGATAITAKGDGVAVSPNITRGGESVSTRRMEMLLEKLVAKDSNIYMDSDKVGSAFAKSATF